MTLPAVYFDRTVEWAVGQLAEAERFERVGMVQIAAAYRRQAVIALDNFHRGAIAASKCVCEACAEPKVYDQDAQDVTGLVVDDFDGAWARIKGWFGFGGAR